MCIFNQSVLIIAKLSKCPLARYSVAPGHHPCLIANEDGLLEEARCLPAKNTCTPENQLEMNDRKNKKIKYLDIVWCENEYMDK